MYYTNSQIKSTLESWYQTNIGSKTNLASSVAIGNYYCEQAKSKVDDFLTSGNATMTTYTSYTPDFKCSTDGNNKGIVNSSVGLLTYDELIYAGGYVRTNNISYYLNNSTQFWTMSPAGFNTKYSGVGTVWATHTGEDINNYGVADRNYIRPVINLKANTQATGSGTSTDPYVIQ